MAGQAAAAGILTSEAFREHYDQRTDAAIARFRAQLPVDLQARLDNAVGDADAQATRWWHAVEHGGHASLGRGAHADDSLIEAQGYGDAEFLGALVRSLVMSLQAQLTWPNVLFCQPTLSITTGLGATTRT